MGQISGKQKEKLKHLQDYLARLSGVAIAFSGGVDSTFLLKVAQDVLDSRVLALTVESHSFPKRERREAIDFCKQEGIRHIICEIDELQIPGFAENPKNRCYICKMELFSRMKEIAGEQGIDSVAEGSNVDDEGDYRPGLMAVSELGILSPLRACHLTKADIRDLSRYLDLPTWDKPSFACLASRFVYGETITKDKLDMVDRAEQMMMDMGFRQVRVRIHGTLARIEVESAELSRLMEESVRHQIAGALREYGFSYVTVDLQGYRTGSMNEQINLT